MIGTLKTQFIIIITDSKMIFESRVYLANTHFNLSYALVFMELLFTVTTQLCIQTHSYYQCICFSKKISAGKLQKPLIIVTK